MYILDFSSLEETDAINRNHGSRGMRNGSKRKGKFFFGHAELAALGGVFMQMSGRLVDMLVWNSGKKIKKLG